MKRNNRFRHESLQDNETIQTLLNALNDGLAKGKLVLEDSDDSMTLEPHGLLRLKISASQDEDRSRLTVRISWKEEDDVPEGKKLEIRSN